MKKMFAVLFGILVMGLMSLTITMSAFAGVKEELQWKVYGLQEHLKVLTAEFQFTQKELQDAQGKLEGITKASVAPEALVADKKVAPAPKLNPKKPLTLPKK